MWPKIFHTHRRTADGLVPKQVPSQVNLTVATNLFEDIFDVRDLNVPTKITGIQAIWPMSGMYVCMYVQHVCMYVCGCMYVCMYVSISILYEYGCM